MRASFLDMRDGLKVAYTIDMDADVLQRIDLYQGDQNVGKLIFNYQQDLSQARDIHAPSASPSRAQRSDDVGILWLKQLAAGTLLE